MATMLQNRSTSSPVDRIAALSFFAGLAMLSKPPIYKSNATISQPRHALITSLINPCQMNLTRFAEPGALLPTWWEFVGTPEPDENPHPDAKPRAPPTEHFLSGPVGIPCNVHLPRRSGQEVALSFRFDSSSVIQPASRYIEFGRGSKRRACPLTKAIGYIFIPALDAIETEGGWQRGPTAVHPRVSLACFQKSDMVGRLCLPIVNDAGDWDGISLWVVAPARMKDPEQIEAALYHYDTVYGPYRPDGKPLK